MRFFWVGLIGIVFFMIPVFSASTVDISPDYLYQNTPVTISYTGFEDGVAASIGFQDTFTPSSSGSFGITGSSLSLPVSLDPGTITSVDGNLFSTSQGFVSDTTDEVPAGTYGVRVVKAISSPGSSVNLSWMVNGTKTTGNNGGQVTFLPVFSPKQGFLNVTTTIGSTSTYKIIPYNQEVVSPSIVVQDISVSTGQIGYANVSLSGLTNGLSSYNLTMRLISGDVGNFTRFSVPSGVTKQSESVTSGEISINATTSLTGSVNLNQALNITYLGVAAGSSRINLTVNSLKDKDGTSVTPVQVINGTLTVSSAPIPGAEFIGSPRSGIVPFNVSFLYTSPDNPQAFNWSFGDNTPNTTTINPVHTYLIAGSHDVGLTVYGATDNYSSVKPDYIQARQVPVWFMGNTTSGMHPLTVNFTGISNTPATSWVYYFGDGVTGIEQNMTHTYQIPGVYTVRAQAIMGNAMNSAIRTKYITVT